MEKETSEIVCILVNKKKEYFIAIVDLIEGICQMRVNDKKPFGYPLELINEGSIFVVTHEVVPGTMTCKVEEADIFRYTEILSNKKLVDILKEEFWDEVDIKNLHKKVEELRNNKIETIING